MKILGVAATPLCVKQLREMVERNSWHSLERGSRFCNVTIHILGHVIFSCRNHEILIYFAGKISFSGPSFLVEEDQVTLAIEFLNIKNKSLFLCI